MLRSVLSVIAGSVAWTVLALGTNVVVMSLFPHLVSPRYRVESAPLLALMLCYALAYSVLGGYVTATLARRREVAHAFALGLLQLALGSVATYVNWETAPAWFHVALLALVVPANVFGGWLRAARRERLLHPQRAARARHA